MAEVTKREYPEYGVLAKIPEEEILARIANGETPVKLAKELGIDKSAISHRFKGNQHYKEARETGMEVRLDEGDQAIEEAGDDLNLARAREIRQRRLEWRAEREFPHRWGAKGTNINIINGIPLDQALGSVAGDLLDKVRTIEGERVD